MSVGMGQGKKRTPGGNRQDTGCNISRPETEPTSRWVSGDENDRRTNLRKESK